MFLSCVGPRSVTAISSDGITENLTTDLSRIRNSFVIARNTASTFKGKGLDAKEIGKQLDVRYVLEGSVQRDGTARQRAADRRAIGPIRTGATDKTSGGGPIGRGHLYKILSNPIYLGRLTHNAQAHDGLHDPIIDQETWVRVRALLAEHAKHGPGPRQHSDALMAGKLFDGLCQRKRSRCLGHARVRP